MKKKVPAKGKSASPFAKKAPPFAKGAMPFGKKPRFRDGGEVGGIAGGSGVGGSGSSGNAGVSSGGSRGSGSGSVGGTGVSSGNKTGTTMRNSPPPGMAVRATRPAGPKVAKISKPTKPMNPAKPKSPSIPPDFMGNWIKGPNFKNSPTGHPWSGTPKKDYYDRVPPGGTSSTPRSTGGDSSYGDDGRSDAMGNRYRKGGMVKRGKK